MQAPVLVRRVLVGVGWYVSWFARTRSHFGKCARRHHTNGFRGEPMTFTASSSNASRPTPGCEYQEETLASDLSGTVEAQCFAQQRFSSSGRLPRGDGVAVARK